MHVLSLKPEATKHVLTSPRLGSALGKAENYDKILAWTNRGKIRK